MKDSTLVGKNEIDGDAQINLKKINQDQPRSWDKYSGRFS